MTIPKDQATGLQIDVKLAVAAMKIHEAYFSTRGVVLNANNICQQ